MDIPIDQELTQKIIDVIARTQKIPRTKIALENTLEELGIDSFDSVNLLFALEDEFDIRIPDETKTLTTIADIVTHMEIFLKERASQCTTS